MDVAFSRFVTTDLRLSICGLRVCACSDCNFCAESLRLLRASITAGKSFFALLKLPARRSDTTVDTELVRFARSLQTCCAAEGELPHATNRQPTRANATRMPIGLTVGAVRRSRAARCWDLVCRLTVPRLGQNQIGVRVLWHMPGFMVSPGQPQSRSQAVVASLALNLHRRHPPGMAEGRDGWGMDRPLGVRSVCERVRKRPRQDSWSTGLVGCVTPHRLGVVPIFNDSREQQERGCR